MMKHLSFRGNKFNDLKLDERVHNRLLGTGFDKPPIGEKPMRNENGLIVALLERYDPVNYVFHTGGQDICLGLEDIFYIIVPNNVTEEEFKYHVRAYVLFAIGRMIEHAAYGAYVSLIYLPLLENIDEIGSYYWGVSVLTQLHHSFTKVKVDKRFDGAGFYFIFKVFALEHLPHHLEKFGLSKDIAQNLKSFPLAPSWADVLNKFNNHKQVDWSTALDDIVEDDIVWESYQRLEEVVPLPSREQTIVYMSRIPLISFEKLAYHRLDCYPRQFGLGADFQCTLTEPIGLRLEPTRNLTWYQS
ncbi:hypothetical protein Vadar_004464 [Vaccinium darrowii]|uniref:Uncharacterized protein n=1 Tax=Vaccinium darrowii TaxID=229202 RepID=A0ACB7X7R0_9ERIC|nr:hypothetical protein Vadar_004464 [Vaccinium darrowii]